MKWLTREWATGDLSDSEWSQRLEDYKSSLESIRAHLPAEVAALASLSLNDAQIASLSSAPGDSLEVRVLTGDAQVGYQWTMLRYAGAHTFPAIIGPGLTASGTEIWYDEIDTTDDGHYQHSMLFHPTGEIEITFESVEIDQSPASPADRR